MRLKSAIFVSALVRRANGAGAFAAVRRRGAEDAGAVFVKVATQNGNAALYGPALPSLDGASADDGTRLFTEIVRAGALESEAEERMARETRYDSDLWFVEIEDRAGRSFLDLSRS